MQADKILAKSNAFKMYDIRITQAGTCLPSVAAVTWQAKKA